MRCVWVCQAKLPPILISVHTFWSPVRAKFGLPVSRTPRQDRKSVDSALNIDQWQSGEGLLPDNDCNVVVRSSFEGSTTNANGWFLLSTFSCAWACRFPQRGSKLNNSDTGSRRRFAIFSKVSNDGAFLPRSIRLRKSTEIFTASANCSCV
jgi:hypothetical protein